jgi:hypothetical protein
MVATSQLSLLQSMVALTPPQNKTDVRQTEQYNEDNAQAFLHACFPFCLFVALKVALKVAVVGHACGLCFIVDNAPYVAPMA